MNDIDCDSYQWDETRDSKAQDLRPYEELKKLLAEKEQSIQHIREHEFQRGFQEGEAAAKEAMDNDALSLPMQEMVMTLEQRILRIVSTLRPTDPGSWGPNIRYVTMEFNAHDAEQRATIEQQAQEIARLREALENIVEGEGLWTKNDMAHEAQQALKDSQTSK